jgi:SAM-dependent methyltransferase
MAGPQSKPPFPLRLRLLELPSDVLRRLQGGSLLDLGCGLGEDLFWLQHHLQLGHGLGVDQLPAAYLADLRNEGLEQAFLQRFGHPIPFSKYQFTSQVANHYALYCRMAQQEWNAEPLPQEKWKQAFVWNWDTDVREFVAESTASIDLVYCAGVLHWLPREEQSLFVGNALRLVKPGGLLAIQANAAAVEGPRDEGPFSYVEAHQVDAVVEGMEVLVESEEGGKASWIVRKHGG